MNPKVFISHASEDKERFVISFSEKLCAHGVDTWFDKWEIKIGDSLVQKIFEDGIGKAESVIIVLSSFSVEKPWVKEELDASFVRKIQGKIRLIPVILDNCAVPECLQHLKYVRINNWNDYSIEFGEILSTLYNTNQKPSLGPPPSYVTNLVQPIPGLTKQDTIILKVIYDYSIKKGENLLMVSNIQPEIENQDISLTEIKDILEIFDNRGYILAKDKLEGSIYFFNITIKGFLLYSERWIPEFNHIFNTVILFIVNHNPRSNHEIVKEIHQPRMIIDQILIILSLQNLININTELSQHIFIISYSPELKRRISN